jgi:hypothetical protein
MTNPKPMIFRCVPCGTEHRSDRGHIVGASREIGELGWRIMRAVKGAHQSWALHCPKCAEVTFAPEVIVA